MTGFAPKVYKPPFLGESHFPETSVFLSQYFGEVKYYFNIM